MIPTSTTVKPTTAVNDCTVQMKHILGNEEKEEEKPREYDKANHLRT